MKYTIALFCALLMISCTSEKSNKANIIDNEFLSFIHSVNEKDVLASDVSFPSTIQVPMYIFETRSGNLVFIDGRNWTLYLNDKEGNNIAVAGGAGRGPGEFSQINHAYMTDDDVLHLLDLRLKRVTKYSFQGEEPELLSETNLPKYEEQIKKIFPQPDGHYLGIFENNMNARGGSFQHVVYKLDDNFAQIREMGSYFGGSTMRWKGTFVKADQKPQAIWHFHDNQLYYARSDTFSITRITDDGGEEIISPDSPLRAIPEFNNNAYVQNNLSDHFEYVFNILPDSREIFNETEIIQSYHGFHLSSDTAYFSIFNPVQGPGFILTYNLRTHETAVIRTAPMVDIHEVYENRIRIISHTEGVKEVRSLRF